MEELWDQTKIFLVHFAHFQKRNRMKRYGLPILLIIIVAFTKHYFHSFLGDNSAFLLASFIVAMSSWYGGLGPGIFATILSVPTIYLLYLSKDTAYHPLLGDFFVLIIFAIEGVIISIVSEARYEMENQKDEFIGFISHELKNPLSSIKGFSGLIINNAKKKKDEKILSYGEQISIQSNIILELINDLLDLTRIEIGKFTYSNSFFNVEDITREIVAHQRIISKNRIIELHGRSKKLLYADKYRVGQVIINLLTNALKYSPENKKVLLRLKETKEKILFNIKDYGMGIPHNEQKMIFNRFYRTRNTERKRSEGLGLGLYIANQIIKHHKGELWVESKEGKGSTFSFYLPLKNN